MINTLGNHRKVIAILLFELMFAQTLLASTKFQSTNKTIPSHLAGRPMREMRSVVSSENKQFNTSDRKGTPGNIHAPAGITRKAPASFQEQTYTGGPGQPEMSSFKSINSNNMVDLFTGDFSYNIPLMDVGGYPVNIHYNSGISMDQEASWVGLGWNINPGVIGRTTRGLPDDFDGTDSIVRVQSIKENRTVGATIAANPEIKGRLIKLQIGAGAFHNTYNGWGTETFMNVSINAGSSAKSSLTGSLGINNNSQTGLNVQPSLSYQLGKSQAEWNGAATIGTNYNSRAGLSALQLNTEVRRGVTMQAIMRDAEGKAYGDPFDVHQSIGFGIPSSIGFATPSYLPTITMPMTNSQYAFKLKVGAANWTLFTNASILGYVSKSFIHPDDVRQSLPAYGYLHFSKDKSPRSLLDFNREKEVAFNAKTTPHIAVPQYSYDVYSISGEGISGSFRPYRGDVGFIYDHAVESKSVSDQLSAELGFGQYFHGGVDFDFTTSATKSGAWTKGNDLVKNLEFQKSDSTFEEVYFRNPGEKNINPSSYYSQFGGDSLIQVKLSGEKAGIKAESKFIKYSSTLTPAGEVPVTVPIVKQKRDKRSQVISYVKAGEAALIGLDTVIRSIPENVNPLLNCTDVDTIRRVGGIRKEHHISEINVLNPDGRRYVYGLPAYNLSQEDVIFSVNGASTGNTLSNGLIEYGANDNSTLNSQGKESYFTKDSTPAHAHSFLLTGILSTDYVDIKGDGITEDDLGDGVKFNYTQAYGNLNQNPYRWRTPKDSSKANYNEGLKTYNRDDKGTYLYGSKEVWYLNSIESKSMVAVFKVSNRDDVYSVKGPDGEIDQGKALKRLDSIQLFSKADLIKNGTKAKPVKTVHFDYETDPAKLLCKGVGGDPMKGKLTLKKIWFTYNNNNKGVRNPYQFYYHPGADNLPKAGSNPNYNSQAYDRWGNYKDPSFKTDTYNPGGLSNMDFPYAVQDSAKAAEFASVWHLTDIKLPSGSRMQVTYESDDYGFVQNKRAVQMFSIAGFGSSATDISNKLYHSKGSDNDYVFVNSSMPVVNKADVYKKFLQGLEDKDGNLKIYFKVAVKMPYENGRFSTSTKYELVPVYAEVSDYGVAGPSGSKRFWLRLKPVGARGVLTKAALQFLRLNLPSKAYPASELGDDVNAAQVVKTMASAYQEIKNSVDGFEDQQKEDWHCQQTDLSKSFVRLGNPAYKKYGGGVRVKQIRIYDNWNAMSGQKESIYGQEYTYTTSYVREANDTITISSGVASYEPMIGGEENAFRLPIEYTEKLSPLGPSNFMYTEAPLGESFFPSPMVGYGKVRVRTINNNAKSANGWTETSFYTSKDFPTLVDNTPIDKRAHNPKFNVFKVNALQHLTVSQGFRIELNDMNGKLKSEAIYPEHDPLNPVYFTAQYYKIKDGNASSKRLDNKVWAVDSASGHINKQAVIGMEVEVMVDVREQTSNTLSGNLGVNIDATPAPFIPPFFILPSAIPLPQREESRFRSIAVTKVVQRHGILDSIVVIDKGSVVSTKNLVFDGETGQVLVTRTNNEHNDPIYSLNYPARWAYSGLGMAYENIGLLLHNKKIKEGKLLEMDDAPAFAEKYFESGDEIWLISADKGFVAPNTATDCGGIVVVEPEKDKAKKLWAIAAQKGKEQHEGIYFIDEGGNPYTGIIKTMRIIRSGKRNFTDAFAGGISSLSSPVREVSQTESRLVVDADTRVINATAAAFKDQWQVENSLYEQDSCYTKTTVITKTFHPGPSMLMHQFKKGGGNEQYLEKNSMNTPFFTASLKNYPNCSGEIELFCRKTKTYRTKSIMKFDLKDIPQSATVISATLDLYPKQISGLWNNLPLGEINDYLADKYNAHYVRDNDAASRTNAAILQRVKNPWNINTRYQDVSTFPETVSIAGTGDNSCESRTGLNVTGLVQPMVANPLTNFGFLMRLQNDEHGNKRDYQFRSLSFCTGGSTHFSSEAAMIQEESSAKMMTALAMPPCSNCTAPALTITYSYQKDTCVKVCRNNITDTTNPYRWGIFGNWRTEKAYTYYADRMETDASSTQTNIRKEGVLKDFTPYWHFSEKGLEATQDTFRWVWNSAASLYNRKGMETENYDPLGRYNAGLYGYNQTLPVAVAQNSKYRELLFDGFEDYHYHTRNCNMPCATPREIDFIRGNPSVSTYDAESHTGRYSLMVSAGAEATFAATVTTPEEDVVRPFVSLRIDSLPLYTTVVHGKGSGLDALYSCITGGGTNYVQRVEGPLDFAYATYPQPLPQNCSGYMATWTGKIQPRFSENYTFYVSTPISFYGSSGASILITDPETNAIVTTIREYFSGGTRSAVTWQPLQAGKLYNIRVTYPLFNQFGGGLRVSWASSRQQREIIPKEYLYPVNVQTADTLGSVIQTVKAYCINANAVQPGEVITPKFSPLQGQKMIVGAWMKVPENCDPGMVTAEGQITASFNTGLIVNLAKTGLPVEGWQRYESVVSIPASAHQMNIKIKAGSSPLLIDDVRVQPYSSNMKAFVYDPVSLRLMAELDENNYASFYEYDDDGTLIRVKKETEKGIQTIKETRSVLLKE